MAPIRSTVSLPDRSTGAALAASAPLRFCSMLDAVSVVRSAINGTSSSTSASSAASSRTLSRSADSRTGMRRRSRSNIAARAPADTGTPAGLTASISSAALWKACRSSIVARFRVIASASCAMASRRVRPSHSAPTAYATTRMSTPYGGRNGGIGRRMGEAPVSNRSAQSIRSTPHMPGHTARSEGGSGASGKAAHRASPLPVPWTHAPAQRKYARAGRGRRAQQWRSPIFPACLPRRLLPASRQRRSPRPAG